MNKYKLLSVILCLFTLITQSSYALANTQDHTKSLKVFEKIKNIEIEHLKSMKKILDLINVNHIKMLNIASKAHQLEQNPKSLNELNSLKQAWEKSFDTAFTLSMVDMINEEEAYYNKVVNAIGKDSYKKYMLTKRLLSSKKSAQELFNNSAKLEEIDALYQDKIKSIKKVDNMMFETWKKLFGQEKISKDNIPSLKYACKILGIEYLDEYFDFANMDKYLYKKSAEQLLYSANHTFSNMKNQIVFEYMSKISETVLKK